jgi:hypothetical protein
MGWLPVLLIVAGVLAMLIGYGLIRGVKTETIWHGDRAGSP